MSSDLSLYGSKVGSADLVQFLDHVFDANLETQKEGKRATPLCIWGTHGLGKTTLVEDFAKQHGWKFAYIAPAQFEEMGDLHGMPTMSNGRTEFAPPSWVPTEEGPGILLIDDINRADDRILRGVMQLLQNFELMSWKLPPKWQIVATANPEGGDYSVTPMDDAMLTRMLHVTMNFEPKQWAKWALNAGVDPRGVSFVLTYPEIVTGKRTTPRSLVQFFDQIKKIPDLKAKSSLVQMLAMATLDEVTVLTLMSFINDSLHELIDPDEILDAHDFKPIAERLVRLSSDGKKGDKAKRVDRLATVCTRLYLYMTSTSYKPKDHHKGNLVNFMLQEVLPNDMKVSLHKDLTAEGSDQVRKFMRDARLSELIIGSV